MGTAYEIRMGKLRRKYDKTWIPRPKQEDNINYAVENCAVEGQSG
jgi:hypothetical protein